MSAELPFRRRGRAEVARYDTITTQTGWRATRLGHPMLDQSMQPRGTLIFFCGKMGAGKTSMSIELSKEKAAVLLSEDAWLSQLFPDQIASFDDYLKRSRQIRPLVKHLVQEILRTGTPVVLDFPANTVQQRGWFRDLSAEVGSPHEMIYLEASNDVCLRHLAKRRREQPERSNFDTEEVFLEVSRFFEEPVETEGLNVRRIEVSQDRSVDRNVAPPCPRSEP